MSTYSFDSDPDAASITDAIAGLSANDPFVASSNVLSGPFGGTGGVSGGTNADVQANAFVGALTVNSIDDFSGMFVESTGVDTVVVDSLSEKRPRDVIGSPKTKYRLYCLPTVLGDLADLCLGLIGQGSTFCIKKNCMTFHVGEKANVNLGDLHVMKTNEACFVEPCVNQSLLEKDLYKAWMSDKLILDDWIKRMAIVNNATGKVSLTAFEDLARFAMTAKKFKASTPMASLADAKNLELLLNDVFKVKVYEKIIQDKKSFMLLNDNKPTKALDSMIEIVQETESALENLSTGLIATNNEVEKINYRVSSEVPVLFSRQENLEAVIGMRTAGTLPNFESPTVWSSISLLSDVITETRKQVDQIHADQVNLKTDSTTVATKVAKELVVQEIGTVDKRLVAMRESLASNLKTLVTRMNRDTGLIMQLQEKLTLVETMINSLSSSTSTGTTFTSTYPQGSAAAGVEIKELREQVISLEAAVRGIESQERKDAVKFARLGFRNIGEAQAWVERHQPGDYTYGLVVDVHMVLEHVYCKLNSGDASQSTITRLDALRKLSVTNLNLGIAIDSFDTQVPKVFSKDESSPHSKNDESFFDQIPDYEAWNLTDYGHRDKILHQVYLFELSHKDAVHNHQACTKDPTLYSVASKSLTESVAWIKSFFLYIDNTYDELTRNKFSPKRGWSLVTRLAMAILKDVGSPRNGVNNLWVVGQNAKICTLMFYSVVKCHDIMERYKGYNFKSDPAISGEYVRFLVMNTGLETMQSLEKRMVTLQESVSTLTSGLKALDAKHSVTAGSLVIDPPSRLSESFPCGLISPVEALEPKLQPPSSPKRKFQAVEVHILPTFVPVDFVLISNGFPIWLLAIEPTWTRSITIIGSDSEEQFVAQLQTQGLPTTLMKRALHRFSKTKIHFLPALIALDGHEVVLLSGPIHFLIHYFTEMKSFTHPIIGAVSGHFHQRFKFGRPPTVGRDSLPHVTWHRVRHESVGGASRFISVFGSINCKTITPNVTTIRRTLGDFINHQSRPNFLADVAACAQPPLLVSDRVSPLYWDQPVAFSTHFFGSGWGIRPLTIDELCSIFSFPIRLRIGGLSLDVFNICTPVQLLLAILHPLLSQLTPHPSKRQRVSPPLTIPSVLPVNNLATPNSLSDCSWLPAINRWLPHSWIDQGAITPGAAKRDDAALPVYLWNRRLQLLYPTCTDHHLAILRDFLLHKVVRRGLLRSFLHFLSATYGHNWVEQLRAARSRGDGNTKTNTNTDVLLLRDVQLGLDVLFRFLYCSWWDWSSGSSLVFWRWGSFLSIARDGMPPFISGTLPAFRRRSKLPKPTTLPLIAAKFQTIIARKYLVPGPIRSLTQYFDVPKGDGDIRLVYNGTSCGFNAALWCPKFWLPTAKTALRSLDFDFYSVDMDLAEMFLNFPLHQSLQEYSGVDLTPYKSILGVDIPGPYHLRWTRTWMGARPSPYCAVRFYYFADEFIRGNNLDPNNPFYWDCIKLNLPGSIREPFLCF